MILYAKCNLDQLNEQGKDYYWERPSCPYCNRPVIGHGYVLRYFENRNDPLFLKRWRCKFCRLIFTMRPKEYWRRFQTGIKKIFKAIIHRILELKWPPWVSRQKGGNWLRKLHNHASLNSLLKKDMIETVQFYKEKELPIF